MHARMAFLRKLAYRAVLAAAIVTTAYNGCVAYKAHRVIDSEGFREGQAVVKSWNRLYRHLADSDGFRRWTGLYFTLRGIPDGEFRHDLDDFLEHAEEFAGESKELEARIDDLVGTVTLTSAERPRPRARCAP